MSVGPKESSPANNEKFQDMSKRKRTEETEKSIRIGIVSPSTV